MGSAEGKHMSQPVILVIDDAGVTVALRDDLDRRFGEDNSVIGDTSAAGSRSMRARHRAVYRSLKKNRSVV
jgi:hypothetical protein